MKVVITDHVYPSLDYERQALSEIGAHLVLAESTSESALALLCRDADVVITCYAQITGAVIENMEKCLLISKTGIGVNNIDVATATRCGIAVTNVPDYCIDEVSDHALAAMLCFARKIPFLNDYVKRGNWSFSEHRPIHRLRGSTLGLVGFGQIARALAEKARPLGLRMVVSDPFVDASTIAEFGASKVSLEELLRESDYISLHVPLTPETRGLIGKDTLSLVKPGAFLINTSRGQLVDESALHEALVSGRLAGAALDVLEREAYDSENPLFALDNVIITPHSAFYSEEAVQELREKVIAECVRVLTGKSPKYLVNKEWRFSPNRRLREA
ncbi:MAG: C-terminal binding protein [Bacillota bacterium]